MRDVKNVAKVFLRITGPTRRRKLLILQLNMFTVATTVALSRPLATLSR